MALTSKELELSVEIHTTRGFPCQQSRTITLSLATLDGRWGGHRAWFHVVSHLVALLRSCGVLLPFHASDMPFAWQDNPDGVSQDQITLLGCPDPQARLEEDTHREDGEAITYTLLLGRSFTLHADKDETFFAFVDDPRLLPSDDIVIDGVFLHASWQIGIPLCCREDVAFYVAFVGGDAFPAYHEQRAEEIDVREVGLASLVQRASKRGQIEAALLDVMGIPFLDPDTLRCLEGALFS